MTEYYPNTRARIDCQIKNLSNAYTDPTQLIFKIEEPDGVETSYTWGIDAALVRTSAGRFYVDWDSTKSGVHKYQWQANGAIQASFGGSFNISEPNF
jgi:hypothetical protein